MDIPTKICIPYDTSKLTTSELQSRHQPDKRTSWVFYKSDNNIYRFLADYSLYLPGIEYFDCLIQSRSISIAFWASDLAPPPREMGRVASLEASSIDQTRDKNDFTIKVVELNFGDTDARNVDRNISGVNDMADPSGRMSDLTVYDVGLSRYYTYQDAGLSVFATDNLAPHQINYIVRLTIFSRHSGWSGLIFIPRRALIDWRNIISKIDDFILTSRVK